MWQVIRAEFGYRWMNYVIFLCLALVVVLIPGTRMSVETDSFLVFLMLFLMVNGWTIGRNTEKRDFQYAQLPISVRHIAVARMLTLLMACTGFVAAYVAVDFLLGRTVRVNVKVPLMFWGFIVSVYSLGLMFRDRFVGTKALIYAKLVAVLVLALTVALGVVTMMATKYYRSPEAGTSPLVRVFEFIETHNPTTSTLNTVLFLLLSLGLALLTVRTFENRRSQIG